MEDYLDDTPVERPLITRGGIIFDLCLVAIFFYCMFGVLKSHVPFDKESWNFWASAYCTTCISGVFWLALQCLRVTWRDQVRNSE
jgi:hypothetical protein